MNPGGLPETWIITPQDKAKHDKQFLALHPQNGFITGNNARNFFLQSSLPTNVLAHIWSLSDFDQDGQLTSQEFSIAMFLIQKKLEGASLPSVLPMNLKRQPSAGDPFLTLTPSPAVPMSSLPSQFAPPTLGMSSNGLGAFNSPHPPTGAPAVNYEQWSLPSQSKPRYRLEFNQQDRNRRGYLTGLEARNLLLQSGLPQMILAQIWFLSDIDADGNMTYEEYCLAQFLIEQAKKGIPLPPNLPNNLRQSCFAQYGQQINSSLTSSDTSSSALSSSASKSNIDVDAFSDVANFALKSREDERRENFLKGQEELQKRQALLKEQMEREEEARREKERQEREKQEKIKQEKERQRQLEIERQLERQRQIEHERAEEARRQAEERERQRKEVEKQRLLQVEAKRLETALQEKRREQELLEKAKLRQLEQEDNVSRNQHRLEELQRDLEGTKRIISDLRDIIGGSMRQERDRLDQTVRDLDVQVEAARAESERAHREVTRLTLETQRSNGSADPHSEQVKALLSSVQMKQSALEAKRDNLLTMERDLMIGGETLASQRNKADNVRKKSQRLQSDVSQIRTKVSQALQNKENKRRQKEQQQQQQQQQVHSQIHFPMAVTDGISGGGAGHNDVKSIRNKFENSGSLFGGPSAFSTTNTTTTTTPSNNRQPDDETKRKYSDLNSHFLQVFASASKAKDGKQFKKYQANFEYNARQDDELNFNKGDIILVDPEKQDTDAQGWLIGQLQGNNKTGLFPETYCSFLGYMDKADVPSVKPSSSAITNIFDMPSDLITTTTSQPVDDLWGVHTDDFWLTTAPPLSREVYERLPDTSESIPNVLGESWLVEALYDWSAESAPESQRAHLRNLTLGEQFRAIKEDGEWSCAEDNTWFPTNYTKRIVNSSVFTEPSAKDISKNSSSKEVTNKFCQALYRFESQESGDLTFESGQIIHILSDSGDWWEGYIETDPQQMKGMFPANYVKVITPEEAEIQTKKSTKKEESLFSNDTWAALSAAKPSETQTNNFFTDLAFSQPVQATKQEVKKTEENVVVAPAFSAAISANATISSAILSTPEVAEVTIPYTGTGPEQLTLEVGQLIQIRKRSDTGWWEGELQQRGQKRRVGWFPKDYVRILSGAQTAIGPIGTSSGSQTPIPSMDNVLGSTLGGTEIAGNNAAALRPKSSLGIGHVTNTTTPTPKEVIPEAAERQASPTTSSPTTKPSSPTTTTAMSVPTPPGIVNEQVTTIYAFKANHVDELSFEKGAIITVLSKDEPEWWRGRLESTGAVGLFPVNYVRTQNALAVKKAAAQKHSTSSPKSKSPPTQLQHKRSHGNEQKRQMAIQELINTEKIYCDYLQEVIQVFYEPMQSCGLLKQDDLNKIFINWADIKNNSYNFYMALFLRHDNAKSDGIVCIGDILVEGFAHFDMYVRYGSCHNAGMAYLNHLETKDSILHDFLCQCQANTVDKKLPLGSYLLKPIQRIARYKLLVENIRHYTPPNHIDYGNLEEANNKICQLLDNVNEAIREQENSYCLEWLQNRVNCDGLNERLYFNSNTNAVGPRKLLRCGTLYKAKSGTELIAFLFNDFLLLTTPQYNTSGLAFVFPSNLSKAGYLTASSHDLSNISTTNSSTTNTTVNNSSSDNSSAINYQFRLYKQPLLLSQIVQSTIDNNNGGGGGVDHHSANSTITSSATSVSASSSSNQSTNPSSSTSSTIVAKHTTAAVFPQANELVFSIKFNSTQLNSTPETILLRARTNKDRDLWVDKLREAHQKYIELENSQKERTMSIRRQQGVGRLLLTIVEGISLKPGSVGGDGKADPYCEVTLGNTTCKTPVVSSTLNPKWNANMQFTVRSVQQEVLSIAVYDKDYFQPNEFLGRVELPLSVIIAEKKRQSAGHLEQRLPLKGVSQGEIFIKVDLLLF